LPKNRHTNRWLGTRVANLPRISLNFSIGNLSSGSGADLSIKMSALEIMPQVAFDLAG
jgi:hypothetical protein